MNSLTYMTLVFLGVRIAELTAEAQFLREYTLNKEFQLKATIIEKKIDFLEFMQKEKELELEDERRGN